MAPPPTISALQAFDTGITYDPALERFVDAGAASNGVGTAGDPYDNIRSALLNAVPGTRIRVAAGTYPSPGSFSNLQGTPNAPIALVADGTVIIDAGNSGVGMAASDARYFVMDGFTIQNTASHGMNLDDGGSFDTPAEFIVLRNMHFRQIGSGNNNDCLKLSGVVDFHLENSEIEGCDRGEAIDMVGCHDGVITGNHFHDVVINGVQTKGGSADILIHGNRFVDIPVRAVNAGGSTGAQFFRPINAQFEAQRIQIVANTFERTGSAAVAFVGCDACVFANNTVKDPNNRVIWLLEENTTKGPGRDNQFINNVVSFNSAQLNSNSFINIGGNATSALTPYQTFTINANLWFSQDDPGFSQVPLSNLITPESINVIQQDPQLDNGLRIGAASPAIGQGVAVPRGVPADFDRRPFADPPELGAFAAP